MGREEPLAQCRPDASSTSSQRIRRPVAVRNFNSLRIERSSDMNALSHWNPFREMEEVQHRMSTLLGLNRRANLAGEEENITVPEWAPLVDIVEDDKEYQIKMELPEVQREDVKVTVENGTLTISGERKAEAEDKGRKFHRLERYYGRFERNFSLPEDADANNVKAEFKDGMLRVHLVKNEKARPIQIEVKVS
jgi:HSP20 family protein